MRSIGMATPADCCQQQVQHHRSRHHQPSEALP
jgi:hypothetical protein